MKILRVMALVIALAVNALLQENALAPIPASWFLFTAGLGLNWASGCQRLPDPDGAHPQLGTPPSFSQRTSRSDHERVAARGEGS